MAFFSKNQCYDQHFASISFVLSQKRHFFRRKIRRKYLKNHNIGPRFEFKVGLSPKLNSFVVVVGRDFRGFFVFSAERHWNQGCQMVYFQTKNPDLGKF
jgi:hypothetical protein